MDINFSGVHVNINVNGGSAHMLPPPPGVAQPLQEMPTPQNLEIDSSADNKEMSQENTKFDMAQDDKMVTKDEAREALLKYIGTTWCWVSTILRIFMS